jgi:hypothetical protein
MTDLSETKKMDIDSDDEEELEEQRKAAADAAPKVEEPEEDTSLANSDVTTKYLEAAKITQAALIKVASMVRLIVVTERRQHKLPICSMVILVSMVF